MKEREDLLLELGVEELSARFVDPLIEDITSGLVAKLDSHQLAYKTCVSYATPRRLAVFVGELVSKQPDTTEQKFGPWKQQAYDASGQPSKALLGFTRANAIAPEQLITLNYEGKERVVARIHRKGKATKELLPELLSQVLKALKPQSTMRWGDGNRSFNRPVRWITARYGKNRVDFSAFGMQTIEHSFGHRFMAPGKVSIPQPADYPKCMKKAWVIASPEERHKAINTGIITACQRLACHSLASDNLIHELCRLVEFPRVLSGTIDRRFLRLPREVLLTTLEAHQRYIGLEDKDGEIAPYFLFVSNMPESDQVDDAGIIKGNEKVLVPRLEDAAFFWDRDCKAGLANYTAALEKVMFETKLGTMADKSLRLQTLVKAFATQLPKVHKAVLVEAASMCKADLVSDLVGEFPELQGIIGGHLARYEKLPSPTCEAISEHYYPRGSGDRLPTSTEGILLALADKLDHLCGLFIVEKQGSADADPFGARRACLGIVQLLLALDASGNNVGGLKACIKLGLAQYQKQQTALEEAVFAFFIERIVHWYQRLGFAITLVQAVLACDIDELGEIDNRIRFLSNHQDQLSSLAQLVKRIRNLLKGAQLQQQTIHLENFTTSEESLLFSCYLENSPKAREALEAGNYAEYLTSCITLQEPLTVLFDRVQIKSGSADKQHNRLTLLAQIAKLCCELVDVTKL